MKYTMSKVEKGEYKRLSITEDGYHHADPVKPLKTVSVSSFGWRKCIAYTLLAVIGLILFIATGSYLFVRHQVQRFTVPAGSESVATFPSQPVPRAELEVAIDQAKLFWDTLKAGETPQDLIVSQDILNGFIAEDDFSNTHAAVTIQEDSFRLDLSLPADGLPGGKGRFFVSQASIETDSNEEDEVTPVTMTLTPPYSVPKIDYPTLMQANLVARADEKGASLQMTYGQMLNWIAPEEWLDEHKELLTCDWDCPHHHDNHHRDHHSDHHHPHHHGDHHGRKLHDHGHHHHDDWDHDRQDCEDIMAMVKRLSVSIQDGQIVVHANDKMQGGNRRLSEKVATNDSNLFSKRRLIRRMLRAAF